MEMCTLGRTGLKVSVVGLGCGGNSRLGTSSGGSDDAAVALIRAGLDLGINFVDTAALYGTEKVVGRALAGRRHEAVLATKALVESASHEPVTPEVFKTSLEQSLSGLNTDHVDLFYLHAVRPERLEYTIEALVPVALQMKQEGKIRFIGLTEAFPTDPSHKVLQHSEFLNEIDVFMIGLNLANASARKTAIVCDAKLNKGRVGMYAVRNALKSPQAMQVLVDKLVAAGQVDGSRLTSGDPLGFIIRSGEAESYTEIAYRFSRHAGGMHSVLTGTGSVDHLRQNAADIAKGPLSPETTDWLLDVFAASETETGDL